ncbi:hypothetical protein [Helicobacter ailurogastricus]|uniref:Uncharacterized protein n=1 Tax=Helicobacter ailurogastricus TaxID=1578720 RepID=A0A0K2XAR0_9HELI|nr:hypothetical protein [Helicobacter ailurogastricus]CRF41707.1 hypothetical protein HAL011_15150 [Helicobacter ailurogastricus]CRF42847.1 hypothetical protein HAL013_10570 [Helicobacter ailurogastricus]CRF44415.1 hypothetical protein HAL09_09970 [Helicobacter ailurogastricus]
MQEQEILALLEAIAQGKMRGSYQEPSSTEEGKEGIVAHAKRMLAKERKKR